MSELEKKQEELITKIKMFWDINAIRSLVQLSSEIAELKEQGAHVSADKSMQYFSRQSKKNEISDILKCISNFDDTESWENKGRYFEVIQKDIRNLNQKT